MIGQGKLVSFSNILGTYRNLFANRISVSIYQQQNAGLKNTTKEKLESLNIPEHPKRPLTPYFRFLNEKRGEIKKQHPEWKAIEIAKQCAEDWKKVNPDYQEKLHQDFLDDSKIYQEKLAVYQQSLTEEQKEALRLARKEKISDKKKRTLKKRYRETDRPKRPLTSFVLFIKEKQNLPQYKDKKFSELLSVFSNEWKNLSGNEKEKYVILQNQALKKYNEELSTWEAQMIKDGNVDVVRKESKIVTTAKNLDANEKKTVKPKVKKETSKYSGVEEKQLAVEKRQAGKKKTY